MPVCVLCVIVSFCDISIVSFQTISATPTISESGKVHHILKVRETLLQYKISGIWY